MLLLLCTIDPTRTCNSNNLPQFSLFLLLSLSLFFAKSFFRTFDNPFLVLCLLLEPPGPPGKPALVPGSPSSAPDVVTIRWSRPTTDGVSPILGYVVEQRRTGSPHWVRACPSLVQQTELSLSGLEPGWRYQFRIMAENIVGRSESSELSDPLTVTLQRNAISAPRECGQRIQNCCDHWQKR